MKLLIATILMLCIISCQKYTKFNINELPKNDTIYILDLSNRNLKIQPDFSQHTIIDLNLSNNKISKFEETKLPKGIQKLNFSNNLLKNHVYFKSKNNFKYLDFSGNEITMFSYYGIAKNLNLSKNQLKSINLEMFMKKRADTLNVSENKDLETKHWTFPNFYKTLINYTITTKN